MSVHTRKLPGDGDVRPGTVFFAEGIIAPHAAPEPSITSRPDTLDSSTAIAEELPWYRRERWLAVQLLALVPILGAMAAPEGFRLALCIVGGALIAAGTVMMLRHDATGRRLANDPGAEEGH